MLTELKNMYMEDLSKLQGEINAYRNDSDLAKVQGQISNSAGNLCLHLCGNIQNYLGAMLGNTGYIRNRDLEFSSKDFTKSSLLAEIEKAKKSVETTFNTIKEQDLDNLFPETPYWKGYSIRHVLIICLNHLNYHLGQINYHRRLTIG